MAWPKVRLALASALFALWSVWLGWQVWRTGQPTLVSQPQLLAAPLVVAAEVKDGPASGPRAAEALTVYKGAGFLPADRKLQVLDWAEAHALAPGKYLLALQPVEREQGKCLLVPIPISPGFSYRDVKEIRRPVYPLTPSIELQVRELLR